MENILFARSQMAMSLAFHIIFAVIGIAMPLLMVFSEILWRRTGDREYLALTQSWAKGTAVFFAVGAVSGTVLSFELGLLFPGFMRLAGPVIGIPFSLEGFAFFTEAIFLGIYLYGWNRIRPAWHIFAGLVVAASGLASAVFVTMANAWMNAPTGFRMEGGTMVDIDPIAAMGSPFVTHEVLHMAVAAYMSVGFAVAAIHAFVLLRNPRSTFHRKALSLALWIAVPTSIVQPLIGHFAGQQVAEHQPMKLAAMESQFHTQADAPLRLGGIPDADCMQTRYALEIPGGLSFIAYNDTHAVVRGLEEIPREDWPSPAVHYGFQLMVALGTFLAALSALAAFVYIRKKRWPEGPLFWKAVLLAGPMGLLAIEAGWTVTEVGRQPWVVHNVLRTADSVTPMPGLWVPLITFSTVYLLLGMIVVAILWRHVRSSPGFRKGDGI